MSTTEDFLDEFARSRGHSLLIPQPRRRWIKSSFMCARCGRRVEVDDNDVIMIPSSCNERIPDPEVDVRAFLEAWLQEPDGEISLRHANAVVRHFPTGRAVFAELVE